jgi:superfamily II DNA or RNA helicase
MNEYQKFLEAKRISDVATGLKRIAPVTDKAFDFQGDIIRWALKRGRAAIFADCGMGKSLMQLEWARQVPGDVLILAPLAVAAQTVKEGAKFGVKVNRCQTGADMKPGINISNYERIEKFDCSKLAGVVLDESSILKSLDGKTRTLLIETFARTPFRLACTATPSPNDYMELGNHAQFLGIMNHAEMLAMFFVHDGGETSKWRLKGHAEAKFWEWVCSWAVMIRKPSNLGYSDDKFKLPKLDMKEHIVQASAPTEGMLFAMPAATLQERIAARRGTVAERAEKCASMVNASREQWLVWCNLNSEADALADLIPDAIEIRGSDSPEDKEDAVAKFLSGEARVLITKPSMFGHGLNLQNCANMAFVGLSDSYEEFYQAVRRCWRFGQKRQVNVHIFIADTEGAVLANIKRKEEESEKMAEAMVANMKDISKTALIGTAKRDAATYKTDVKTGAGWELRLGDCVEQVGTMADNSIHYSIYSPPFASLYTYSNSDRDMGNSKSAEEFAAHYQFLIRELYRVTMPGRLTSFHCMNLPTSKVRDGVIGIRDFRGELIRAHEAEGWIFHSEVCIWKDPVTAMQRTKALGLLHKQIKKDSCMSRQGIPDYLVTMRKPGDNPERVTHTNDDFPVQLWQNFASPVWMDINPNETLQYRSARENNDERHICPLQLEVIRRGLKLWSNPGDTVLSPFAGIGSEGHEAIRTGRKFIGVELKEVYWKCAANNLAAAEASQAMLI